MGSGAGRETHLSGPSGLCTPVRTPQGGGGQDSALLRGTCGPDVCVGDSKAKGLGCSPASRGHTAGWVLRGRAARPRLDTESGASSPRVPGTQRAPPCGGPAEEGGLGE